MRPTPSALETLRPSDTHPSAGDGEGASPVLRALSPLQEHGLQEEALGGRAGCTLGPHILLHIPSQVLRERRDTRPMASELQTSQQDPKLKGSWGFCPHHPKALGGWQLMRGGNHQPAAPDKRPSESRTCTPVQTTQLTAFSAFRG